MEGSLRRAAPAGSVPGVQPEVGVEVGGLVEALAADVAAEGLLAGVDAVVPLQHADCGEALPAHAAAVGLLLGVPARVDLQLAGEAEALAALAAAVPPLDALPRLRGAGQRQLEGPPVLDGQREHAGFQPLQWGGSFWGPAALCGGEAGAGLSCSAVQRSLGWR